MALVQTHARCFACNQYSDVLIDLPEANSPQGECNATGCSGAGRPSDLNEPGVLGPGEILAKLRTCMVELIAEEQALSDTTTESEAFAAGCKRLFQCVESLIGAEAQA